MPLDAVVKVVRDSFRLDAAVAAADRELVALVGPNGAGKTTLLRAIAGLESLESGQVTIDGGDVTSSSPDQRRIGLVPQREHLLPHLSALDNVAFGLRCRGTSKRDAREAAERYLAIVGLSSHGSRRPSELSGGEAKRVALARALATSPRVLLLDEPFAGLDASTRIETRRELRRYLEGHDGVRILVTHEPIDALAIADRIAVLEGGRVVQDVAPEELRVRPRSRYVADLVGVNLFRGTLTATGLRTENGAEIVAADAASASGPGFVTIHPRAVALYANRPDGSPRNVWRGRVTDVDDEGERLRVQLEGDLVIVAEITPSAAQALNVAPGAELYATAKATDITVYPA